VLTDMIMPEGMSGSELAERLRADRPQLKVIFTTGYSHEVPGRDTEFVRRNRDFFLQKPYQARELLQKLRQCLGDK